MGDVDNPGSARHDHPWAHTGLDRALTDHGDTRKIGMFFPELTLLISRTILEFEVVLFSSSLVIMSLKKLNCHARRC